MCRRDSRAARCKCAPTRRHAKLAARFIRLHRTRADRFTAVVSGICLNYYHERDERFASEACVGAAVCFGMFAEIPGALATYVHMRAVRQSTGQLGCRCASSCPPTRSPPCTNRWPRLIVARGPPLTQIRARSRAGWRRATDT